MTLRKAIFSDLIIIWEILQQAIEQRRKDGSEQWQNGYPNQKTVSNDITNGWGYVLIDNNQTIAYAAIIFGVEPAYNVIEGNWLTNDDYAVIHRVATSNSVKRRGVATKLFQLIEELAIEHQVFSIKVDTNFDNFPMLKILEKLGYHYCGEIFFGGAPRKAFEKVLCNNVT
jgi:GNAT superfamily N-acetyltransferase